MKILINLIMLLGLATSSNAFSQEDWRIYDACKEKVYDNKKNGYNYKACKEMLDHKKALRKYGASSSYKYWINRLEK